MLRSLASMLNFRRILAIALLALWGPVTLHCGMEVEGMFGLVPTHVAKATNPHEPVAPDTDPGGCAAIENGHFESLLTWFTVAAPVADTCVMWVMADEPEFSWVHLVSPESSTLPLDARPCWVFHRRAASSPRAPAFVS